MAGDEIVVFWFRRDLRLDDNRGLRRALESGHRVLPLFIFDTDILSHLEPDDARITFLCESVDALHAQLRRQASGLLTIVSTPARAIRHITESYNVKAVYTNLDYEPYGVERDREITTMLTSLGIPMITDADHIIFEPGDILKADGSPYTVFTPFLRRWKERFSSKMVNEERSSEELGNLLRFDNISTPPTPEKLGFKTSHQRVKPYHLDEERIINYSSRRDFPAMDGTTGLGPHLRFGTVSIREVFRLTEGVSTTFTSELVWREFFMHILHFFPRVAEGSFRAEYDNIQWINNEDHFDRWCMGQTGYPLVDAGMRELHATGTMHNRVRMVTASFLAKHLLCDWRWGEAWFGSKLHDFELSSNNGNWQWAAGTGCDAAPYFRIFSPEAQQKRFDPNYEYIRKWVPEYDSPEYPSPIVENSEARARAIAAYRKAVRRR